MVVLLVVDITVEVDVFFVEVDDVVAVVVVGAIVDNIGLAVVVDVEICDVSVVVVLGKVVVVVLGVVEVDDDKPGTSPSHFKLSVASVLSGVSIIQYLAS